MLNTGSGRGPNVAHVSSHTQVHGCMHVYVRMCIYIYRCIDACISDISIYVYGIRTVLPAPPNGLPPAH